MKTITTIVSLILLLALVVSPIVIIRSLNKRNIKFKLILYLAIGIAITATLTIAFAWWSATSNKMLLSYYGYNLDGMNEAEYYKQVSPENMERVKSLETSVMGVGWPLKAFMMYEIYLPYILIVYFIFYAIKRFKERTTPNTSLLP